MAILKQCGPRHFALTMLDCSLGTQRSAVNNIKGFVVVREGPN